MPIYEYRCTECGFQKEHLQKINDAALDTCPSCGAESYQKQLSAAGFQLKGNGWYATDFKGSSTPTPSRSEAAAAPAACGGSCACHPN